MKTDKEIIERIDALTIQGVRHVETLYGAMLNTTTQFFSDRATFKGLQELRSRLRAQIIGDQTVFTTLLKVHTNVLLMDAANYVIETTGAKIDAKLYESVGNLMTQRALTLTDTLKNFSIRDARILENQVQKLSILAALKVNRGEVTFRDAIKKMRAQGEPSRVIDRAGRRIDPTKAASSLLRQHYLDTYNDAVVFFLSSAGYNALTTSNRNLTFKVDEYEDIKSTVFYPTSDSLVRSVHD